LHEAIHYIDSFATNVIMQWQLDIEVAHIVGEEFMSMGGSLHVKLNTMCGEYLLPLYYMS
jgi:hypothetical protein